MSIILLVNVLFPSDSGSAINIESENVCWILDAVIGGIPSYKEDYDII